VTHSLVTSRDNWDSQLEGTESGRPGFFRTLRLYLTHFRGHRSAIIQIMAAATGNETEAWETLIAAIGLSGASVGQRWTTAEGVPRLSGVIEHLTQNPNDALIRLDKPGPGVAALGTYNCGQTMVCVNLYLYGDQAATNVDRESPLWDEWIQQRFPMPAAESASE
jgi:hypothetical protein